MGQSLCFCDLRGCQLVSDAVAALGGVSIALHSGKVEPHVRLHVVLRHAFAGAIQFSHVESRLGVAELGGLPEQAHRRWIVGVLLVRHHRLHAPFKSSLRFLLRPGGRGFRHRGRAGTPGRGPSGEYEVAGDLATRVLQDQVDALAELGSQYPDLDLSRVGITGWSFGGYLSALAVAERPEIFHVAVAGAPVTDWSLYDTAYTERYLGDPREVPEVYRANSVVQRAEKLQRPLMLIHGLADDNVVSAHTLILSGELLTHAKPHTLVPLSGVTHMTPQAVVAENLMLLTVDFLDNALRR